MNESENIIPVGLLQKDKFTGPGPRIWVCISQTFCEKYAQMAAKKENAAAYPRDLEQNSGNINPYSLQGMIDFEFCNSPAAFIRSLKTASDKNIIKDFSSYIPLNHQRL